MKIPAPALKIIRPLAQKAAALNLPIYVVGGCVRDWLLGRTSFDIDLVTEGDPAPLAKHCGKLLSAVPEAFGQFGTLRVVGKNYRVDFAASRRENYPHPASLPQVSPAPIELDLFRRDFTINAMALPVSGGKVGALIDPYGGLEDLRKKNLRVLHPASFRDDPTRVFRAARFLCRFKMRHAPGLIAEARAALQDGYAGLLSRHRLAHELLCVLAEEKPGCVLKRLRSWGYLDLIHPGIRLPARALPGVEERLGAMALAMGTRAGKEFLSTLPLERPMAARLMEILELASNQASPLHEPGPLALRVLKHAYPKLPATALRPLFVNGGDLKALGMPPGKKYSELLDAAAREQWAGKIKSRAEALRRLKMRII